MHSEEKCESIHLNYFPVQMDREMFYYLLQPFHIIRVSFVIVRLIWDPKQNGPALVDRFSNYSAQKIRVYRQFIIIKYDRNINHIHLVIAGSSRFGRKINHRHQIPHVNQLIWRGRMKK